MRVIYWYFRFLGKTIHKFCHFFLFESKRGECVPQEEEGITDCAWDTPEEARRTISYDNARAVLEQATAMVQAPPHVVDGAVPEQPAPPPSCPCSTLEPSRGMAGSAAAPGM